MQEQFKSLDFLGFPNYSVSNFGYVVNDKFNRVLKEKINHQGYHTIYLSKDNIRTFFRIHRLVALAFIPNPNKLPQVNHKDENKSNNRVDNLEWCDNKYNSNYGTKGKRLTNSLTNRVDQSKPVKMIDLNTNEIIQIFPSAAEAARFLGKTSNINIVNVCNNKPQHKSAYGYRWEYA